MFYSSAVSPVVRLEAVSAPGTASARAVRRAATAEPGPQTICALAEVDPALLDDAERVEFLQAWEKAARWVAAQHAAAVVAVAGREPADRDDVAREFVRAALAEAGGSARACVDTARALTGPLAAARDALARGQISEAHVRVLAQETAHLEPTTARAVTDTVLARARGRTPAQLRRTVRTAVIAADPAGAQAAAERAGCQRRVTKTVLPDAQAELVLTGPAIDVQTVWTALDLRAARRSASDLRTLDQRRFDALVTLCRQADLHTDQHTQTTRTASGTSGVSTATCDSRGPATCVDGSAGTGTSTPTAGTPTAGTPTAGGAAAGGAGGSSEPVRRRHGLLPAVYVYADAATWAGLADSPVQLEGYGPIPAGTARAHFQSSTWRAVVTDALTQRPLAVSTTSYRPSPQLSRLLHLRDRGCQMPGCAAAVWHCDTDHHTPHASGGPTDPTNCGLLCRRHHRLKTFTDWDWTRDEDGAVTWTDPHGHTWRRPPDAYPMPPPTAPRSAAAVPDDPPF